MCTARSDDLQVALSAPEKLKALAQDRPRIAVHVITEQGITSDGVVQTNTLHASLREGALPPGLDDVVSFEKAVVYVQEVGGAHGRREGVASG